ncbi:hypothetical protein E4P82_06235 [Candidatus Competibacter phosphatis]|uniref:Uncharacterized protein n=1 Tax=Candidatus Competibacter phosphatis TaxID=221280 RepID=A0ABX1TL00_9GAMM|nr:hypothetical protein [Candidatus Competibacter phosphatis]NMQ18843.1 hypothetical protein [Candidatus Competibacter phosphatis]
MADVDGEKTSAARIGAVRPGGAEQAKLMTLDNFLRFRYPIEDSNVPYSVMTEPYLREQNRHREKYSFHLPE